MPLRELRIATRRSKLALWQTSLVKQKLQLMYLDLEFKSIPIVTKADKIQNRRLAEIGGKGLFVKALETALLHDKADIAVHSMKDVPPELANDFAIPVMLQRDDPRDVLVSNHYHSLDKLPKNAVIGTCSVRRQAQLLAYNPCFKIKPLRGNVDTRLQRLDTGEFDAIILAAAGLQRLGLANRIREFLDIDIMLPSVGQGAIGIEVLQNAPELALLIAPLADQETMLCVNIERALVKALHGNCHSPIGAYASIKNNKVTLIGRVASVDGRELIAAQETATLSAVAELASSVAMQLRRKGAEKILLNNWSLL